MTWARVYQIQPEIAGFSLKMLGIRLLSIRICDYLIYVFVFSIFFWYDHNSRFFIQLYLFTRPLPTVPPFILIFDCFFVLTIPSEKGTTTDITHFILFSIFFFWAHNTIRKRDDYQRSLLLFYFLFFFFDSQYHQKKGPLPTLPILFYFLL